MTEAGSSGRRPGDAGRVEGTETGSGAGPGGPVPSTVRGPLAGLADLAATLGDPTSALSTFLRGLVLGALVGAAIAGARMRRRRRR